ncbi:hypothetical protein IC614_05790 [Allosphingosinicella flava]|uniref:Uncharacterized protein n=1 Tax=Allosphingosinicella flava TaxID=2771430 RepID=A0A7T2LMZ9_9SPHN|nr:hypothetical protein [Sphingosinicella flava]QPQ56080.1 hypothetical protein IC614_05790 [Sphingosinicella flava]
MFDILEKRVQAAAERRVETLAAEARASLPGDIKVEAGREVIRLTGPGLRRRLVLDRALSWLRMGGWR